VRYVFGSEPMLPMSFTFRGWTAGVVGFEDGVLIDVPISEGKSNRKSLVALRSPLGLASHRGSGAIGRRAWSRHVEWRHWDISSQYRSRTQLVSQSIRNLFKGFVLLVLGIEGRFHLEDSNLASVVRAISAPSL